MKQCPRCFQTYSDDLLNFCLQDGELLREFFQEPPSRFVDDSPPTVVLNEARRTNPTAWPVTPPTPWQPGQMQRQGTPHQYLVSLDKTIPTVALVLGILSLPMCWCGWLGLPAMILGIIGKRNADRDPSRYGGSGLAIAGMIMGIISMLVFIIFIIAAAVAD